MWAVDAECFHVRALLEAMPVLRVLIISERYFDFRDVAVAVASRPRRPPEPIAVDTI